MKPMRRMALALLLVAAGGCVSGLTDGDRFFLDGDLTQAEAAYRAYLTGGRAEGNSEARARYRLGVIYSLPESDLQDREKAYRALSSLVELEPGSSWSQQADFLLSLWAERDRLLAAVEHQRNRTDRLLAEIGTLQDEAERVGDEVEDRQARVERLTQEIGVLQRDIGRLGHQLAAREQELDQIKRIDLETPP